MCARVKTTKITLGNGCSAVGRPAVRNGQRTAGETATSCTESPAASAPIVLRRVIRTNIYRRTDVPTTATTVFRTRRTRRTTDRAGHPSPAPRRYLCFDILHVARSTCATSNGRAETDDSVPRGRVITKKRKTNVTEREREREKPKKNSTRQTKRRFPDTTSRIRRRRRRRRCERNERRSRRRRLTHYWPPPGPRRRLVGARVCVILSVFAPTVPPPPKLLISSFRSQ